MRFFAAVLLVIGVGTTLAASGTVAWQPRTDGIELAVDVGEADLAASDRGFVELNLAGAGASGAVGGPRLPVYRRLVEVPYGAEIAVEVAYAGVAEYDLDLPLMPRQAPVPKTGPEPGFAYDEKAYRRPTAAIGAVVVDEGYVRGHRVVLVEVRPATYDPAAGLLSVAREVTVRLRWTAADWAMTSSQRQRYDSPAFRGRLDGIALNHGQLDFAPPPDLPVGYLVIVPDAWEQNVAPLAEWRKRKGYDVFVRNLTEVGGGSANAVKGYIQDAYDNWPIPPSFVLLVGDVDNIGYFDGQGTGSPNTDLNFAMVEGSDYFPDIDVSRASVVSTAQLDSLVYNIVTYERNEWANGLEWTNRAYFIASSDGGNHQVAEGTHQYVMEKLRPMGVQCDSLWLYYSQGTPITTAINGGRAWVTYSGHGSTTSWADPGFGLSDVRALTNEDKLPYVQTFACVSGNFASSSSPECFSEAWIRNGRRGAIAHIASSVNSYWEEDDTLERRVFDFMFDSTFHWIMGGFNKAKMKFYEEMGPGGTTRRYFEMYNMMGDGAIDVYAHEPQALDVTYPAVIPLGAYPLQVTVTEGYGPVENALVCAAGSADTTVFAAGYTDAAGQVTLNITTTAPDTVFVTVTGHDLAPHLGQVLALPSSGPYVLYLSHVVDDSAGGNDDGIINPGESINLGMWVKNWGSGTANSVESKLRTSDANITLTDSVKGFGDIPAGDSAFTGADGFDFEVAVSCTNGYVLRFTVRTCDANDSVWEAPLNLTVGAPVLGYESWLAFDPPPGGNNNGVIEPGETGDLEVVLRNTGMGHAYGVTATLRSGDPRLAVLDSLGGYGTIMRDSAGRNSGDRFKVRAENSIPRETEVPCTLLVHAGAIEYRCEFTLGIGAIRTCDPIPDGPRQPALYYAYDACDSLYTEAPEFSWVEIGGIGTRLDLSDDDVEVVSLPSGFGSWRYYGQDYGQLSICSNGFIAPGSQSFSRYTNEELPVSDGPPMVCAVWDDFYPGEGNGVWYWHDADNHRFVVEYDSVHYYAPRSSWDKFQVVLYDSTVSTPSGDNVFTVQYLTANNHGSATVGIQDQTQSVAIQYLFDGTYHRGAAELVPGMAVKYTTSPPTVGIEDEPAGASRLRRLALMPCAPNPVRSHARLSFTLPVETRARLSVFDASGRKVRGLFDARAKAGRYSVTWDGRDDSGREVARGVYLYRLETEVGGVSRKLVRVE